MSLTYRIQKDYFSQNTKIFIHAPPFKMNCFSVTHQNNNSVFILEITDHILLNVKEHPADERNINIEYENSFDTKIIVPELYLLEKLLYRIFERVTVKLIVFTADVQFSDILRKFNFLMKQITDSYDIHINDQGFQLNGEILYTLVEK